MRSSGVHFGVPHTQLDTDSEIGAIDEQNKMLCPDSASMICNAGKENALSKVDSPTGARTTFTWPTALLVGHSRFDDRNFSL